jgi:hypothetical protein
MDQLLNEIDERIQEFEKEFPEKDQEDQEHLWLQSIFLISSFS